jgi:hypothetical protein
LKIRGRLLCITNILQVFYNKSFAIYAYGMTHILFACCWFSSLFCDFETRAFDTYVEMNWTAKQEAPLHMVRKSTTGHPQKTSDGTLVYLGNGTELRNVMADRNLENGTSYFYTVFSLDNEMKITNMAHAEATPTASPLKNFIVNGNFMRNLSGWSGSKVPIKTGPFGKYVDMPANTHLFQKIQGLKPKTLYTCSVKFFTNTNQVTPTFMISGGIQQEEQLRNISPSGVKDYGYGPIGFSYIDSTMIGKWVEKRFVFWTARDTSDITLTLSVAKRALPTSVIYADVQVIEGVMPYYEPQPKPPILGQNMLLNQDFNGSSPTPWILSHATIHNVKNQGPITNPSHLLQLNPSDAVSATAKQTLPYILVNGKEYQTIFLVKVDPEKIAYLYLYNGSQILMAREIVGDGEWHHVSPSFKTPETGIVEPMLLFSAYKQQGDNWHAQLKMPVIPATGKETLPETTPPPKPTYATDTYSFGTLDGWHVLNQKGSIPSNISLDDSVMKITAYGNTAPEDLQKRGAIVLTDKYYASGKYSAWMKIGKVYTASGAVDQRYKNTGPIGCCFALWPYSYIDYAETALPQAFDEPNPIRNTEIDIEIPADLPKGAKNYSFSHGRLNTWGGQRGGDGGNIELHRKMPDGINPMDGAWHKYTIEWNSGTETGGGNRTPGFVKWYLDDKLWGAWEGASYGFDNIPYRCTRFYLGAWFPASWAGDANWYRTEFFVKDVTIEPTSATSRDEWIGETSPDHYWP